METPESSLDGLAMERVGQGLHEFATRGRHRLVVTSNLTNAEIIPQMFGGPARNKAEIAERKQHVLDLLVVAAPNSAVTRDRRRYAELLERAISGRING